MEGGDRGGPNDILECPCTRCKHLTRRRRWIVEKHVRKYGEFDITPHREWIARRLVGEEVRFGFFQTPPYVTVHKYIINGIELVFWCNVDVIRTSGALGCGRTCSILFSPKGSKESNWNDTSCALSGTHYLG